MGVKKINISIVLANLSAGGAERVLTFVAEELDKTKFNTTLVVIGRQKDTVYDVKDIEVIYFEKDRVLFGIYDLFSYFLKNKPDIVLSAVAHVNTVVAYLSIFFPKTKFIAREVTLLSIAKKVNKSKDGVFDYFANRRFKYFDKIICQSQAMYEDINTNSDIDIEKFVIINNPITDGFEKRELKKPIDKLNLITVGSFKKVKGHDRVIKALAKLTIPFHYTLVGDGTEKDNIFNLIEELKLTDKITHIPFTSDVSEYLSQNNLFLQGSYTEGFPNALIESNSVGLPVIAFASPGGHNEIIIDGVNGYIIESEVEFANKLTEVYTNYIFDFNDVSNSATSRYAKNIILKKYEFLFESFYLNKDNPKNN